MPKAREVTAMTATGISGAGPGGVLRMTWVQDRPLGRGLAAAPLRAVRHPEPRTSTTLLLRT